MDHKIPQRMQRPPECEPLRVAAPTVQPERAESNALQQLNQQPQSRHSAFKRESEISSRCSKQHRRQQRPPHYISHKPRQQKRQQGQHRPTNRPLNQHHAHYFGISHTSV